MSWKPLSYITHRVIPLLALGCLASAEVAASDELTLPADGYQLAAATEVHLRLLEPVASNTHQHGDRFRLEVVDPVVVGGVTVIPVGVQGEGQVIHAAKGGFGGRAGELILASRFVKVGEQTVKLRSFSAGSGQDRVNLAVGLSFVVVGIFVTGKDIALPAGTDVWAKIADDTLLAEQSPEAVINASLPVPESSTTEINEDEFSRQ